MTHEVEIRPGCSLTVAVHDDATLTAEVTSPNLTVAARNPDTLYVTLADYGVDMPPALLTALWRDVRNARALRVAQDPEARRKAEETVERIGRHLGLLTKAVETPSIHSCPCGQDPEDCCGRPRACIGGRTITDPLDKEAA